MQLRYLKSIELKKSTKQKQTNGTYLNTYQSVGTYDVELQEIVDEASVSIYGATVNKMYRISSVLHSLEVLLKTKMTDKQDNISFYYISYNNGLYKINAVRNNWIDIEYIESL